MTKRKIAAMILTALILVTAVAPVAFAASVEVTGPTFTVTLNGTEMNNAYSQYPLIVYNDITYFPMTYYDCRFLGLETVWSQEEGLRIIKTGTAWPYTPTASSVKNRSSYTAKVAGKAIQVNGEVIDNSKEEYPLLEFRNVTYFPLTWRFAVDSFGWQYQYTDSAGLSIRSDGASPDQDMANAAVPAGASSVREVILPIADHGFEFGKFTQSGGYYYYEAADGKIYQVSVADPANSRKVYDVPANEYTEKPRVMSLDTINGKAYLTFRIGSDTKGDDVLVHLKEDGTSEEILRDKFAYQEVGDTAVYYWDSGPPYSNNLFIKEKGDSEFREIGDPQYRYYGAILKGGYIYASGSTAYGEPLYLFRIHCETGNIQRLTEQPARIADMNDTDIYFIGEDSLLYKIPIAGSGTEKVSDVAVKDAIVLGNTVYYEALSNEELYKLGQDIPLNPGGAFNFSEISKGDHYIKVKYYSNGYTFMLLDENGIVAKSIEKLVDLYMDGNTIVYVKYR